MRKFIFACVFCITAYFSYSQNNLLYNPVLYNPAVAGQNGITDASFTNFNIVTSLQGVDYNGQTLNFSMPLKDGKFGIGGNIERNEFTYDNISKFNGFFAYHRDLKFGTLSLGTSLGMTRDAYDFSSIRFTGSFPYTSVSETDSYLNLGVGAFFNSQYGYIGLSSPNIFNKNRISINGVAGFSYILASNRQAILSGGLRLPVFTENVIFRPSFVITQGEVNFLSRNESRTYVQLNASFQLFESFWLNTTLGKDLSPLRTLTNELEFGIGYQFRGGLRLGLNLASWQSLGDLSYNPHYMAVILGKRFSKEAHPNYHSPQAAFF